MEIVQTGKFKSKALETLVSVENPLERVSQITLKRLGYLLGFVEELGDETLAEYVNELYAYFQSQMVKDFVELKSINLTDLIAQQDILKDKMELSSSITNYHLQLLELPEDEDWKKEFNLPQRNVLRSVLVPAYYNLEKLIEKIGRESAVGIYKKFITKYLMARQTSENEFEKVEDLMKSRLEQTTESSEWVMKHAIVSDGKYAYINENCLWMDALSDMPDSEIKYGVCCYGDFQGAKLWNEHFILTMEHTIAQGDPYCSRLLHDTRIDWDLRHPEKKFWDDMKS